MLTDKEVKAEFKKKAQASPEQYYATSILKREGFSRKRCSKCSDIFWSTDSSVCNKVECAGGFTFVGNPPVKKMSYVQTWKRFAALFKKLGYTPIKRYPVVARWRDDTDFVQASIYDFQPYVVSGEVEPPANPLVVPQFCLRFNDIDNVGITGSHYTGFVMIGQCAFMPKEKWDQEKIFSDIYAWLRKGLGLPTDKITFHEDAWAGGGNFGPSMEFFSHGLELGNQVYMMYENTPSGYKELKLKVCDMGMGHERNAWFSQGTNTSYDAVFPKVMKNLFSSTGLRVDHDIAKKFAYFGGLLNIDEVENIDTTWKQVSKLTGIELSLLKNNIIPLSSLYSVAEHTRSLLVAISDGALPSNVGGGYNLRAILRRALSFIDEYDWELSLPEIAKMHARELKPLFPELSKNLSQVEEILCVEEEKYKATKEKSYRIIAQALKTDISESRLLELYDSHGIVPEMIKKASEKLGRKITMPENFYGKVAELHEKVTRPLAKLQLPLEGLADTELLYYTDQDMQKFNAEVLRIIENKFVVLDKTAFYPRGGGQEPDHGFINNCRVYDVEKIGNIVVHAVENINFTEGNVACEVDWDRRMQLTKHHTAVHIVNAASIKVLGNHIFQAGAKKDYSKAHLDITHYKLPSENEIDKIEKLANKVVHDSKRVTKSYKKRGDAESKYGFKIYQGGAVPGKLIRIVEINHFDVEACGGTHLHNTAEAEEIIITKAERIQDGVVRIELVAGGAAKRMREHYRELLTECRSILGSKENEVKATQEIFNKWKRTRKQKEEKTEAAAADIIDNMKRKFVKNILVEKLEGDMEKLKHISKILSDDETVIILFGVSESRVNIFGAAGQKTNINVGSIVQKASSKLNGKGGGGKTLGQGIGFSTPLIDSVISEIKKDLIIADQLNI